MGHIYTSNLQPTVLPTPPTGRLMLVSEVGMEPGLISRGQLLSCGPCCHGQKTEERPLHKEGRKLAPTLDNRRNSDLEKTRLVLHYGVVL